MKGIFRKKLPFEQYWKARPNILLKYEIGRIFNVSFVRVLILLSIIENKTNTQQGTHKDNSVACLSLALAFTRSLAVGAIQAQHAV